MRTVSQIPRPVGLGIWLPVSHAPSWIVTTIPSRTGRNALNNSRRWGTPRDVMMRVARETASYYVVTCLVVGFEHGLPYRVKKHGLRDSVDKNRGRRPMCLSLPRPEGHAFHTAWQTMIKSYYSTFTDWCFPRCIHINMNFGALNWAIFGSLHGC